MTAAAYTCRLNTAMKIKNRKAGQDIVFSVRLPPGLARRVRVHAALHDLEIRKVVRQALERSLPKVEAKP